MRLFATIIFAALLCATASAQTLKSLMYNATNGQVVYPVANALRFESENLQSVYFTDIVAQNIEAGIGTNSVAFGALGIDFAGVAAANTRTNLGLGATWLTNTNVTNFRTAVGLGVSNSVIFNDLILEELSIGADGISFQNEDGKANTRANLGFRLAALTNTSNVTMVQALSGAAAAAYSGTVIFTNIQGIVVSNGIIVDIEE